MPKTYTPEVRAEAVALAKIVGAREAGRQLGLDWRSIRSWSMDAGVDLTTAVPRGTWAELAELAMSKVLAAVASGRIRDPRTLATVGAIAQRNAHRDEKPITAEALAVDARDAFFAWLEEQAATELPDDHTDADVEALVDAMGNVGRELLQRANAEHGPGRVVGEPLPHRRALLAWHSGRTEWGANQPLLAGDVLEWAQGIVHELITEHGSLAAWHTSRKAEDTRLRAEQEALWRQREQEHAERLRAYGTPTEPIDLEVAAVLAEAEQSLQEQA